MDAGVRSREPLVVIDLVGRTPLVVLLAAMIGLRLKGHISALVALAVGLVVAVGIFHMPTHLAVLSTILGAGYGLFPIFWIVFPVIFMYQLTVRAGRFGLLHECLVGVTEDSRLQLLLIALSSELSSRAQRVLELLWLFAAQY